MKSCEEPNDVASAKVAETGKERRIQRLDKAIDYYGSKKHILTVIISIVFGIVELRYGAAYIGQCFIQPMIAYFLIVHGSVMLFEVVIGILALLNSRVIYKHHNQIMARRLVLVIILIMIVVNLFCFAWFIAGNVWVFGAISNGYQGTDATNLNTYCVMDLFRTAFGIIISRYIIVGIIIVAVIVVNRRKIMQCCKQKKSSSDNDDLPK